MEEPGFLPKSSCLQNPVISAGGGEIEDVCIYDVFITWGLTDSFPLLWCTPLYPTRWWDSFSLGQCLSWFPSVLWAAVCTSPPGGVTLIWGAQHSILHLVRWHLGPVPCSVHLLWRLFWSPRPGGWEPVVGAKLISTWHFQFTRDVSTATLIITVSISFYWTFPLCRALC